MDTIVSFSLRSPAEISTDLAARLKQRRLARGLTQEGLSRRADVPLGTLKKFEATGAIALPSFVRLVVALGDEAGLEKLLGEEEYRSLDQILESPTRRRRGRIT